MASVRGPPSRNGPPVRGLQPQSVPAVAEKAGVRHRTVLASWSLDFVETEKGYELTADLPGLDQKDVEVKIAGGVLTVKAEKEEEKEETKKDFHLRERRFGSFERALRMPEGVDTDKIEAHFKKGVLTVMLPKTAEAQKPVKKIEVKGE